MNWCTGTIFMIPSSVCLPELETGPRIFELDSNTELTHSILSIQRLSVLHKKKIPNLTKCAGHACKWRSNWMWSKLQNQSTFEKTTDVTVISHEMQWHRPIHWKSTRFLGYQRLPTFQRIQLQLNPYSSTETFVVQMPVSLLINSVYSSIATSSDNSSQLHWRG